MHLHLDFLQTIFVSYTICVNYLCGVKVIQINYFIELLAVFIRLWCYLIHVHNLFHMCYQMVCDLQFSINLAHFLDVSGLFSKLKLITLVMPPILCLEPLILHSLGFHTSFTTDSFMLNQSFPLNSMSTFSLVPNTSDNVILTI